MLLIIENVCQHLVKFFPIERVYEFGRCYCHERTGRQTRLLYETFLCITLQITTETSYLHWLEVAFIVFSFSVYNAKY
jgi:hypothetical protein